MNELDICRRVLGQHVGEIRRWLDVIEAEELEPEARGDVERIARAVRELEALAGNR